MKKSLFAIAAVTAFAGAAQAQSSVTVYGLYDGGLNVKNTDTRTSSTAAPTVVSNADMSGNQMASSRIGFRGTEALGNGVSAIFNLEFGFDAGNGTLSTTTVAAGNSQSDGVRTAVLGLTSNAYGTLNVGRQLSGIHGIVAGNVFGGNNMYGDATYSSYTNQNGNAGRISNQVTRFEGLSYQTPTVAGFSARADVGSNRATGAATATTNGQLNANLLAQQDSNQGIRVDYTFKEFGVSAATTKVVTTNGNVASVTGAQTDITINALQARYRGNNGLVVEVTFANNKAESASVQSYKTNALKYGVSYALTPAITTFVQYGSGISEASKASTSTNTANTTSAYQVGATYTLSKRTNLYAAYGYQKSENKSTTGSIEGKEFGLGMLHTF
jgi:predicted porin